MASLIWAVILLAGLTCTSGLGTHINLLTHPSLVQIEFRVYGGWSQQCVGNIVSSFHVISAASCLPDDYSNRRIRAGAEVRGIGGYVADIANVVSHPSYGLNGNDGDIAIIKIYYYFPLGPTVNPVAIVPQNYYLTPQTAVDLVGWGSTAEGNLVSNNYIYSLELLTKSFSECRQQYANLENPRGITSNMICVGLSTYGGRDIDTRDAGAPIFYLDVLAGVVSFGVPHGQDAMPVVATAIGSYTNWIVETAEEL